MRIRLIPALLALALGAAPSIPARAMDVDCARAHTHIFTLDGILRAAEIRRLDPDTKIVTLQWGEVKFLGLTVTGNSANIRLPNGKEAMTLLEPTVAGDGVLIARAGSAAGNEILKLVRTAPKAAPAVLPEPVPREPVVRIGYRDAPEPKPVQETAAQPKPNGFPVERFNGQRGALTLAELKRLDGGEDGVELVSTHLGEITFLGLTLTGNSMNILVGGKQRISALNAADPGQPPIYFARAGTPAAEEIARYRGDVAPPKEAPGPRPAPAPKPPLQPPVRRITPPAVHVPVGAPPAAVPAPAPAPPAPRPPARLIPTEPPRVAAGRPPAPVPEPTPLGKYYAPDDPQHSGSLLSAQLHALGEAVKNPKREKSEELAARIVTENKAALSAAIDWQGVAYIVAVPTKEGKPHAATRLASALVEAGEFPGVTSSSILFREPGTKLDEKSFRVPPLQYENLDGKVVVLVDDGMAGPARVKAAAQAIANAGGIPRIILFGLRER
ncbi:MAG TPA: hypothetical protein VM598_11155 [Bdellovibrionota bacterium]|nr:hypothetical protein [Bdellovibrionota bacterium]